MSDTSGGPSGVGGVGDSSSLSSGSLFSAGALGLGALGFGAMVAQGPGSLPAQYGQLTANAPFMTATGQQITGEGQALVAGGKDALAMAEHGQLTPEQQAQLGQYSTGLENTARQQFYSMGVNPDQNTAFVTQQGNIDAQVNAMAQAQIQTTIQLGLGEISGGNSLISSGLGFENAANQALLQAGEAQLKLDTQYSSNLTSAFGAIGSLFGTIGKGLLAA